MKTILLTVGLLIGSSASASNDSTAVILRVGEGTYYTHAKSSKHLELRGADRVDATDIIHVPKDASVRFFALSDGQRKFVNGPAAFRVTASGLVPEPSSQKLAVHVIRGRNSVGLSTDPNQITGGIRIKGTNSPENTIFQLTPGEALFTAPKEFHWRFKDPEKHQTSTVSLFLRTPHNERFQLAQGEGLTSYSGSIPVPLEPGAYFWEVIAEPTEGMILRQETEFYVASPDIVAKFKAMEEVTKASNDVDEWIDLAVSYRYHHFSEEALRFLKLAAAKFPTNSAVQRELEAFKKTTDGARLMEP